MQNLLLDYYLWIKALHIIAMVSWMAAMLYLPRLYVYHAGVVKQSPESEMLKIMEYRLLRYIATPAMMATWLFGIMMITANPSVFDGGWMHVKLTCVILLSALHGIASKHRKRFAMDENVKSPKYFRVFNELPTILMIIIIIMAIVKPF